MVSLSLQDVSTSNSYDFELDSYALVSGDDDWAAMRFTQFEWIFGLDNRGFPFDSEFNIVKAPKDLIPCLEEKTLRFAPTKDVIQHVYNLMEHNDMAEISERRRFEEFGEGPWEYVLFPGYFDHKTLKPEYLPPLYQRSSNGEMLPLTLDAHDYDALPRISSMLHPTIAILLMELHQPDVLYAPQSLKENVIHPILKIIGIWPAWSHNRFKPEPTSKRKRRRSETSDSISCKCTLCAHISSSESSSSSGTYASDIDSSDDGERVSLPVGGDPEGDGKVELDVAAWAGKVVLPPAHSGFDGLDDFEDDHLLRTYAQESALDPEQVKKALKGEDTKRNALAESMLEELRCRLSKRSRHG
ncbi:hypothetical protein Moror_1260 [Moniliophthora roreri MCA 2997]|uniref:Uncharacterized protein n=2 Tax=Moniliophthora roreri TaxID=221103 RepID=V2WPI4_MONRO|nr:hypothetical protein Moror_1260 [Moniliophthora roreri MCA 2997]KAI3602744.1 hypothetical protein WG66_008112 [Moniliophthora roreri]